MIRVRFATAAALSAMCLARVIGLAQATTDDASAVAARAARARRIAQQFEAQARVLTVFDRQGRIVRTVGPRAIYEHPVFSPDRSRLAATKRDLETETRDVWVLDVATGKEIRITSSQKGDAATSPTWSPDGGQIAYVATRDGHEGLYRTAATGAGAEELLYKHPGAWLVLSGWSMDGRFLSFYPAELSGGTLYVLPLAGAGERQPVKIVRAESQLGGPGISPNGRFMSYQSNQSGSHELYVRPLDLASAGAAPTEGPWQVSDHGGLGPAVWRRDGKELYYLAADRGVMSVDVSAAPTFKWGKPRLLFRPPEWIPVSADLTNVSSDGERIVIAVPHAPTLQQITIFDRQGHVLSRLGEPGRYQNATLSPDGTRVAVTRRDPRTNNRDIWTFDVASGKGTAVTKDSLPEEDAPIWSPDGSQLAYGSTRGILSGIYRKAWNGTGREEHLFQDTVPDGGMVLMDWSTDGRFLTFAQSGSGIVLVLPLDGDQNAPERKAIDWLREEYLVAQGRFSPDSRFIAYLSDEIALNVFEVYVRPFDATPVGARAAGAKPVQVSTAGARGMIAWRQDGRELYYLTGASEVMAVDLMTTPAFHVGTPRLLFQLPAAPAGNPQQWKNVSADGQRFVFTMSVPVNASTR